MEANPSPNLSIKTCIDHIHQMFFFSLGSMLYVSHRFMWDVSMLLIDKAS